ncbi:aaa family atpase [Trichoderma arundinaceum]|uniref:Aaa family atpase n=1 Tax=Trichoderma arundinaceum TaxID=490622 RepID=A0A395NWM6_TRIAR|nr:aaa family atpase [Trichoderma arundinaceum]
MKRKVDWKSYTFFAHLISPAQPLATMADLAGESVSVSKETLDTSTNSDNTIARQLDSTIPDTVKSKQLGLEEELLKLRERLAVAESDAQREKQQREQLELQIQENNKELSSDNFKTIIAQLKRQVEDVQTKTEDANWSIGRKVLNLGWELRYIESITSIADSVTQERDNLRHVSSKLMSYCNMLKAELQNARPGGRIPSLEEIDEGENREENLKADIFNDRLKAELNPMDWNTFKFPRNHDDQKGQYCVIDILIEEPIVTFDGYDNPWYPRRAVRPQESTAGTAGRTEKSISSWRDMANNPDPSKQLVPERIRIRSKYIFDVLNTIFESKLKAYDSSNGVVMVRPFRALVHYDKDIREKFSELGADRLSQLKAKFDGDKSRQDNDKEPGNSQGGHLVTPPWRSWSRKDENSLVEYITLHCVYIDFDGKQLGPVTQTFTIEKFDGEKAVTALEVYPIRFAEGPVSSYHRRSESKAEAGEAGYRSKLIERGRMFVDVASIKHMHYNGFTLETRDEVDSQVMVDFAEAFAVKTAEAAASSTTSNTSSDSRSSDQANNWQPKVQSIIGQELGKKDSSEKKAEQACSGACCIGDYVYDDAYIEKKRNENYVTNLIPSPEETNIEPPMSIHPRLLKELAMSKDSLADDDLLIMSYRVFGFVLRSRKWAKLDLTYLTPVNVTQKDRTAFDQLVLPAGHKDIVHCLVAQHFRDKEARVSDNEEVDIVRGKGKGLIILLHGAPGVGKTTTAEGVAERFNKPLFQITCGDLGTTANEVETALERNFSLANRWGCILLLDEADVFLAQRSPKNFIRNGLVAVFLRVLEYYAGILFLTTNRIGDFDEAFASRIHVSLYYPPLDLKSTRKIFKLNLRLIKERFKEKQRTIVIHKKDILNYASDYWEKNEKMRWNGRQIRNACQTALAMAEFDAQKDAPGDENAQDAEVTLSDGHIKTVFGAYLEFMRYLKNIYGKDAERVAKDMGIRAREAAMSRIEDDDDDDTSDSDDDEKKPKKTAQPASSAFIPATKSHDGIPAAAKTSPGPNLAPSLGATGPPTPSSAPGSVPAPGQAPNMYMAPNSYPGAPNFFPPYMMFSPQQFMQGQGQYQNMPQQAQASLAPGGPPQMPNMAPQMPNQGWPNMNWQGMQGGPMIYPGMGRGNDDALPKPQPQS